jgi:formylglycine-generating enzyme required for sulfatase activity
MVSLLLLCLLAACGPEADVPAPTMTPGAAEPKAGDTRVRNTDGMVMVYVPAGEFLMGSTDEDLEAVMAECADCEPPSLYLEQPQHTVYVDAFWIDQTEVTNAQYRQCVEAGDCREPECWGDEGWQYDDELNAPDQPVVCVSWYEAQAYAAWAGGRLPTEAEWEKAARGTDGRVYPWGSQAADCDLANYGGCLDEKTAVVGSYPAGASPYGALDMAGNALEWVGDWYEEGYYTSSPDRNPEGPGSGEGRVLRGGSFYLDRGYARCARRVWDYPDFADYDFGFRLVVPHDASGP